MSARVRVLPRSLGLLETGSGQGTALVLGGSGCVGRAVVAALCRAGFATLAAQRHEKAAPQGATHLPWDATGSADIRSLLHGASCVVNAVSGDSRTLLAATRATAAAAREGCRIVHVSSMSVYGDARGYVRETTMLRGSSRYATTKIACEDILAHSDATILRPGIVYGAGSTQWVGRIGRMLRAGRLGDLGKHGDGRCNLVHARDLGEAVVAALRAPQARGQVINIGMAAPPRWNDYLVALGRAIGAVPVPRIPGWRLSLEARLLAPPLYLAGGLCQVPNNVPEPLSPALSRIFAQDIVLDCTLFDRLFAFPRTRLSDGLCESASWFLETYGLPAA